MQQFVEGSSAKHFRSSSMSFNPAYGACCTARAHRALHLSEAQESGREIMVNGIPCYETLPSHSGKVPALLVFSDIFGWRSGRTRQLCDEMAEKAGVQVLLPNFFHEDGSTEGEPLSGCSAAWYIAKRILYYNWSNKHNSWWASLMYPVFWTKTNHVEPVIRSKLIPYLTESGQRPIGALGFCWGGWLAFHSASIPEIQCAIAMHPSVKMEKFHGGNSVDLYAAISCPTMCLAASDDPEEVKPSGALSESLDQKGLASFFQEYPDMKHGWVPRGKAEDSGVAAAVTKAVHQSVLFLQQHLPVPKL